MKPADVRAHESEPERFRQRLVRFGIELVWPSIHPV
jgi:hypothetical protein